ncbi:hypothetical protein BSL78_28790 [Apostichopus japonicus]|uniref:Uncharacterized protein n=1 Tax=Stichopus japonicus TaxID=307972 RepID=A0A2G8JF83_STIJA|nr:hypothetical protein BSL78_28790 [Apostichopus japonicus]
MEHLMDVIRNSPYINERMRAQVPSALQAFLPDGVAASSVPGISHSSQEESDSSESRDYNFSRPYMATGDEASSISTTARRYLPRVRARRLPRPPVILESPEEGLFDEEGRVRTFRLPRPVITIAPTSRYHYEDGDSDDTNDADTSTINSRAFSDLSVQPGAPRPGFLPFDYF